MKKIQLLDFVPALITFGPMAMVLSLGLVMETTNYALALAGAVALASGLASMLKTLKRQQQEILRLGQLLRSDDPD